MKTEKGGETGRKTCYVECPDCEAAGLTARLACECGRPFTAKDEWPRAWVPKWVRWLLPEPGLLLKGETA